ncbi:MAG: bifunctional diaminohydroxyphosphoribosylaminopyrimidine deaminase/5-amino-6-(5-phosphoribosylamino)uracil reductase RibD [Syntrophales bacterium]|nr:bifunctional diaminohydroxyphosphoribosylaminopyrimidine deaminase/5-amino-6-(5-phosphoribosylamino)uracil reductase RibD [Syntrophales bacterium]
MLCLIVVNDDFFMKKALNLARRGAGYVSPNPMVGAVVVKEGRIISEGWHKFYGGPHGEIVALDKIAGNAKGSTLYVNLEPCCHHGQTPPCVNRIIKEKISRVVVGVKDPNPLVSGKGIEILRRNGITTDVGILEDQCRRLNEIFFKYIITGLPFVTVKFAQTLDGRIATTTGDSRWISSLSSLKLAHKLRSEHDAVLVGCETVIKDDPELTVRLVKGRNPIRVILDSHLRTPLTAKIFRSLEKARTMVFTTSRAPADKMEMLKDHGIEVIAVSDDGEGVVNLKELLRTLGHMKISSILVEGGARVITNFIKEHLADRIVVAVAPKIIGKGIEAIGDLQKRFIDEAIQFREKETRKSGEDIIFDIRTGWNAY